MGNGHHCSFYAGWCYFGHNYQLNHIVKLCTNDRCKSGAERISDDVRDPNMLRNSQRKQKLKSMRKNDYNLRYIQNFEKFHFWKPFLKCEGSNTNEKCSLNRQNTNFKFRNMAYIKQKIVAKITKIRLKTQKYHKKVVF